ncbi:TIGR03086 family metal-binding protein [Couchioplanes azureus]|uniref:TIGR03086 family metal-binding protein n=1 Tax=Couchioplanes caeruleus TaxID=56438 RepID=UPI0016712DA6|nr:TIGR03086 family metal-binding protein [Couchioplanes caeruleus]GGQ39154.1 TIGR03086 family protein [Couchioplanes caeruleus subsp. azureus]
MQLNTILKKSVTEAGAVVRGVGPGQFHAPSPCADWDVRALTNHLLQVASALHLAGRRQPVPGDLWGRDLMSEGWADRFDEEGRAAAAAWAQPGAWDGTVGMGGAEMPARVIATMLVSDLAIHGWDLARATGQDYHCDDDVAEATWRFLAETGEQGRRMGIYGTPVTVADHAAPFERALALSGRDPHWVRPCA